MNLTSPRIPESQVSFFLFQILSIVKEFHSQHRVVKGIQPQKFFFNKSGFLVYRDSSFSPSLFDQQNSQRNCLQGDVVYFSPGFLASNLLDFSFDFWSIGVLLIFLLDLEPPLANLNSIQQTFQIVKSKGFLPQREVSDSVRDFLGICFDHNNKSIRIEDLINSEFISKRVAREDYQKYVMQILDLRNTDKSEHTQKCERE